MYEYLKDLSVIELLELLGEIKNELINKTIECEDLEVAREINKMLKVIISKSKET